MKALTGLIIRQALVGLVGVAMFAAMFTMARAIDFTPVYPGWNILAFHGDDCFSLDAYSDFGVTVIAYLDAESQVWALWAPDVPAQLTSLTRLCPGQIAWFRVNEAIEIPVP